MTLLHHQDRTIIKVSGVDAIPFLQGVLTNDITTLKERGILYTLMLTPQGRYHFDTLVHDYGDDSIYLDISQDMADDFYKRLNIYKLRSDVTLEALGEEAMVITADGQNYKGMRPDPRSHKLGHRGLVFGDRPTEMTSDATIYNRLCLQNCIPRTAIELIPEKTIPLEANMDALGALCFDKGCYLGQELTTRTKHQGLVRKKLYTVTGEHPSQTLTLPCPLYHDEKKVGELYSFENDYGIAKLRIEHVVPEIVLHDDQKTISLRVSGL